MGYSLRGKHITTWEGFLAGEQGFIVRPNRAPYEKMFVEQRTLSNVGGGYVGISDNGEHDANFSQTGVATSPTVNFIGGMGLVALGVKLCAELMTPKKRMPHRRR